MIYIKHHIICADQRTHRGTTSIASEGAFGTLYCIVCILYCVHITYCMYIVCIILYVQYGIVHITYDIVCIQYCVYYLTSMWICICILSPIRSSSAPSLTMRTNRI